MPNQPYIAALAFSLSVVTLAAAQTRITSESPQTMRSSAEEAEKHTEKLTAADRESIVEKLAKGIEDGYVLEERGHELAMQLRQMGAAGRFTDDDPQEFATELSRILREISSDLHLRVAFGGIGKAMGTPQHRVMRVPATALEAPVSGERRMMRVPASAEAADATGAEPNRIRRMIKPGEAADMPGKMAEVFEQMSRRFPDNYRSKILPGNVGFLEIDILFPPHDRLDAAMQELADTDALILDLRSCPGGSGYTARYVESTFFAEPTLLLTTAHRGQEPLHIMSFDEVPGGMSYLDKPVYVLTSNGTGSGCEELAWVLKYHNKAILIGENTAGAGHGITGTLDLGHDLSATIPSMRPIHPLFEEGFEGIGVPPDLTITSRRAADEAHLMALSAILEKAEGANQRELESFYTAATLALGRREREYVNQGRSLRSYSASFEGGRRIYIKDGELYYSADGRMKAPLLALDEPDHFEYRRGMSSISLNVERNPNGDIDAIALLPPGSTKWQRFKRVRAS